MRTIHFLPVALLFGMIACNNASETNNPPNPDSLKTAPAKDTMNMGHAMDSAGSAMTMTPAPADAKVYFKNLKDGQTVTSPFKVEMGVDGIKLDTAGSMAAGTGHHHLLIDAGDSIPAGEIVPKDEQHKHFGKAQTSCDLSLTPGKHVLTLQLADGLHRSYGSKLAATISVTVK